jgi:hypothetical protein
MKIICYALLGLSVHYLLGEIAHSKPPRTHHPESFIDCNQSVNETKHHCKYTEQELADGRYYSRFYTYLQSHHANNRKELVQDKVQNYIWYENEKREYKDHVEQYTAGWDIRYALWEGKYSFQSNIDFNLLKINNLNKKVSWLKDFHLLAIISFMESYKRTDPMDAANSMDESNLNKTQTLWIAGGGLGIRYQMFRNLGLNFSYRVLHRYFTADLYSFNFDLYLNEYVKVMIGVEQRWTPTQDYTDFNGWTPTLGMAFGG